MQIPILSGIYADTNSDFRTRYPRNMVPVPKKQGISNGYLRPSDGIISLNDNIGGFDRNGVNWDGVHYRVIGQSLNIVAADGGLGSVGTIPGSDRAVFTQSFDLLAICASQNLYYYDGNSIIQVTDPDLGDANDVVWIDGYFITTDGENIVVTELSDPTMVNPTKYGSSEVDPDPVVSLLKIRNELAALNRFTIEFFSNVGGTGFPFQRIEGAQVSRGVVGRDACVEYNDTIIFVGGARNEAISVWIGVNGGSTKIATREIDQLLKSYTETELATAIVEERIYDAHAFIYIHLPNETVVYDFNASAVVGSPVWHTLTSGLEETGRYNAINFVYVYNRWHCAHPTEKKIGYLSNTLQSQYGEKVGWAIETLMIYNEGKGAVLNELELITLTGNSKFGDSPTVAMQYSLDGIDFTMPRFISSGRTGQRDKRIAWRRNGHMRRYRTQRFFGDSDCFISIAALEAQIEPLAW